MKAKADSLVSKALVSTQVSTENAVSERQIVEAGAEAIAHEPHKVTGKVTDLAHKKRDSPEINLMQGCHLPHLGDTQTRHIAR